MKKRKKKNIGRIVLDVFMSFAAFLLIYNYPPNSSHSAPNTSQSTSQKHLVNAVNAEWPPFAFTEKGVMKGSALKITKDVLREAHISFDYKFLPWARVYYLATHEANYLIGGIGRTNKREKLFHWIGPVTKGLDNFLYKKSSNPIQISTIEGARAHIIGVVRGGYNHDFLIQNGFKGNKIIDVSSQQQLWRMLDANRVSFVLLPQSMGDKKVEIGAATRALFTFHVTDYMAFSKKTPLDLVEKIRHAYKRLNKEGKIILE